MVAAEVMHELTAVSIGPRVYSALTEMSTRNKKK
jgi:hypothetical protein